jgi:hypothetical protein
MIFNAQSDLTGVTADNGQLAYCMDIQSTFIFNGTTWMPSARTVVKKSTVNINGKTTGATSIYTLEASNLKFYPIIVIIRAVNISGVTTAPTVSVGTNSTSYNNIATASLLNTILSTIGATGGSPNMATASYPISGGTSIFANVSIAAIATNYTFNVEIVGFYDN